MQIYKNFEPTDANALNMLISSISFSTVKERYYLILLFRERFVNYPINNGFFQRKLIYF